MLTIDGSTGEGGGQILRSSLALSAITQQPLHLKNIRAQRSKPGLHAQHLCSVRAAAQVSNATVTGDELHSQDITFQPQAIIGGYHECDIGTAGSCSLVLQTILPMFLHARCQADIRIHGGTHNPWSPSLDFIQYCFIPLLRSMGADIELTVEKVGFYPRGGGCIHLIIDATHCEKPLSLLQRGAHTSLHSIITSHNVPEHIGEREMAVLAARLALHHSEQQHFHAEDTESEGNFVSVIIESEHITECCGQPAKRGIPAERVANNVCNDVKKYLKASAPVGEYLADQLLLPMLVANGGTFLASCASLHSTTNAAVITQFCGEKVTFTENDAGVLCTVTGL